MEVYIINHQYLHSVPKYQTLVVDYLKETIKTFLVRWKLSIWTENENDVGYFTDLENDSEILNLINGLNTTMFLLDTAHQKEDLIHKSDFFHFHYHMMSLNVTTP